MSAAADLRRIMPALEKARARAAELERRMQAAGLRFSKERGYLAPLREHDIRRELELVR